MADISERAGARASRMWWKIGTILQRRAEEMAEKSIRPENAATLAALADACFFQATGEGDYMPLKTFVKSPSAQP